jgi:5-methylcytosine-specific restriction endonuclease McrBC regulatory subunit McrC
MHYKPVISLCKLILEDAPVDVRNLGERTGLSFLIDMDKVFEKFVSNLLIEYMSSKTIVVQQTEYPEVKGHRLSVIPDIQIIEKGKPVLILDTKYSQRTTGTQDMSHVAQMSLYYLTTGAKNCALIYPGQHETEVFVLRSNLTLYAISIDTTAKSSEQFRFNCNKFLNAIDNILSS